MASRDLQRPSICRKKPHSSQPGVQRGEVEIRSVLVRFAAVEDRSLSFPSLAVQAASHNAVRDVGGVEPVMRDGCEGTGHCGAAMRKCRGPQRGFANGTTVQLQTDGARQRTIVRRREFHEEVMWMLAVVDR